MIIIPLIIHLIIAIFYHHYHLKNRFSVINLDRAEIPHFNFKRNPFILHHCLVAPNLNSFESKKKNLFEIELFLFLFLLKLLEFLFFLLILWLYIFFLEIDSLILFTEMHLIVLKFFRQIKQHLHFLVFQD